MGQACKSLIIKYLVFCKMEFIKNDKWSALLLHKLLIIKGLGGMLVSSFFWLTLFVSP